MAKLTSPVLQHTVVGTTQRERERVRKAEGAFTTVLLYEQQVLHIYYVSCVDLVCEGEVWKASWALRYDTKGICTITELHSK